MRSVVWPAQSQNGAKPSFISEWIAVSFRKALLTGEARNRPDKKLFCGMFPARMSEKINTWRVI
ncbi:MAG: hypothetical protein FWF29_07840 [Treponema sp.]|nr:hypothetical protein [Treponema sp.]